MAVQGEMFGRYMLLDRVAAGGMAEVWRAKISGSDDFQRIIAIKKILPHVAEDQDFISMFRDEAKITVQLQHSNIGQVIDFNKVGDVYYIAMEYIPGKDLKTIWNYQRKIAQAPLDMGLACYICQQMADGLDYSHRKVDHLGQELIIVHRDVSPQNVLVSWDGEVKVIDFGIAKAAGKSGRTQAGVLKGKFGYMAPEQIRGVPLDGRADVFALGVVLYEMLCGKRAFQAKSDFALLEKVRKVKIVPPREVNPQIPRELEQILMKALAKNRDERYRWASDFSQDLQRFLLMSGKPPSRYELAEFLKIIFPTEHQEERERLERYRSIKPPSMNEIAAAPAPSFNAGSATSGDGNESTVIAPFSANTVDWDGDVGEQTFISSPPPDMPTPPPENSGVPHAQGLAPTKLNRQVDLKKVLAAGGALLFILVLVGVFLGKGSGTVAVNVQGPDQSKVMIDGDFKGHADPSLNLKSVSVGYHVLTVEAEGYIQFLEQILVEKGKLVAVNAELKKKKAPTGKMTVVTDPPGAAILIDGEDSGKKTPFAIDLDSEVPHIIKLVLKNHHAHIKTNISIAAKEEKAMNVKLKPSAIMIKILSQPMGADVILNGELLGQTPYILEHNPDMGYPKITVKKRNCRDKVTTSIPFDPEVAEMDFPVVLKRCR
jgi:serine/threonine protein kinase